MGTGRGPLVAAQTEWRQKVSRRLLSRARDRALVWTGRGTEGGGGGDMAKRPRPARQHFTVPVAPPPAYSSSTAVVHGRRPRPSSLAAGTLTDPP
jgi:hypothetical protein